MIAVISLATACSMERTVEQRYGILFQACRRRQASTFRTRLDVISRLHRQGSWSVVNLIRSCLVSPCGF